MRFRALLLLLAVALLMGGCAPKTKRPVIDAKLVKEEAQIQREMFAAEEARMARLLLDAGERVLIHNAEFCPKTAMTVSLRCASSAEVGKKWQKAYEAGAGLHERVTAYIVPKGGPAWEAGIRPGDVILSVNGQATPNGVQGVNFVNQIVAESFEKEMILPINFVVKRGELSMNLMVTPVEYCNFPITVEKNDAVNAYADGERIVVYTGLERGAKSIDDIAIIVAHELGHNAMEHPQKSTTRMRAGAVIGALLSAVTGARLTNAGASIGARMYSQTEEHEADYLAVYFAARAGFDVTGAPHFWRRMSMEHSGGISHGSTHPPNSERFVAVEAAVNEVLTKQRNGKELKPNMLDDENTPTVKEPEKK